MNRAKKIKSKVFEWFKSSNIVLFYGPGGCGKSSAATDALFNWIKINSNTQPINLWSAYDLHLAEFFDEYKEQLKANFLAANQSRPNPSPPIELALKYLSDRKLQNNLKNHESIAELIVDKLSENKEILFLDGCEHWHNPDYEEQEDEEFGQIRFNSFISNLIAYATELGNKFEGKIIITHRKKLKEFGNKNCFLIPELDEAEIEDFFIQSHLDTGKEFEKLCGLLLDSRYPLVWRAIHEVIITKKEFDTHTPVSEYTQLFYEKLKNNTSKVLQLALSEIEEIETKKIDSKTWSLTNLLGLLERPVELQEFRNVNIESLTSFRIDDVSKAELMHVSARFNRTGFVTLREYEEGRWSFGAHQEIQRIYNRKIAGKLSIGVKREFAKKNFGLAKKRKPVQTADNRKNGIVPDISNWSDLFINGVESISQTAAKDTYDAFRDEYWFPILKNNDCTLLIDYDSVDDEYRIMRQFARGILSKNLEAQKIKGYEKEEAIFFNCYGLSNWHTGNLIRAKKLYNQGAVVWLDFENFTQVSEMYRRICEIYTVLGNIEEALKYGKKALTKIESSLSEDKGIREKNQVTLRPDDLDPYIYNKMMNGTLARALHFSGDFDSAEVLLLLTLLISG